MRANSPAFATDGRLRLSTYLFTGARSILSVVDDGGHSGACNFTTYEDHARLSRAVDAFNAAMDGATLLPVHPSGPDVPPIPLNAAELVDDRETEVAA